MEKNLIKTGRIILSVMFIFSGLSKVISINFFDTLVGELFFGKDMLDHYTGMYLVQILTRVIISGELLLGAALLQEKHFKKIVLPFTFLLLLAFTIHLIYDGFRQDNFVTGNCGCFGKVLPMTILESILKNVVTMIIAAWVWWKYRENEDHKLGSWVFSLVLGLVCLGTVWFTIVDYKPIEFSGTDTFSIPENTINPNEGVGEDNGTSASLAKVDSLVEAFQFEEALEELETLAQKDSSLVDQNMVQRLKDVVEIKNSAP